VRKSAQVTGIRVDHQPAKAVFKKHVFTAGHHVQCTNDGERLRAPDGIREMGLVNGCSNSPLETKLVKY
jgi:hypothetical protein